MPYENNRGVNDGSRGVDYIDPKDFRGNPQKVLGHPAFEDSEQGGMVRAAQADIKGGEAPQGEELTISYLVATGWQEVGRGSGIDKHGNPVTMVSLVKGGDVKMMPVYETPQPEKEPNGTSSFIEDAGGAVVGMVVEVSPVENATPIDETNEAILNQLTPTQRKLVHDYETSIQAARDAAEWGGEKDAHNHRAAARLALGQLPKDIQDALRRR